MTHGARVTLMTRSSCQLCGPARLEVERACVGTGESWTETDIGSDRELALEYGDRVPVVLLDGSEFASLMIDGDELAAALRG